MSQIPGMMMRRAAPQPVRAGVGMSSAAIQNLSVGVLAIEVGASGAVLGAVVGALVKGSMKSAGVGGAIGAVLGAAFGGFTGYEIKQGAS